MEGIFDYFAFYNLLQDQDKPVVVSTLGSHLTPEAASILQNLDIGHFIVAYDWDTAGRQGIERIAAKVKGWVYYLGGMKEGQDPFDLLSPAVPSISGFSLNRLMTAAKKAQENTDKPVNVSFISSGPRGQRNVIFKPNETAELDRAEIEALESVETRSRAKEYHYNTDDFIPLLSYDHKNKAMLDQTIEQIIQKLKKCPAKPSSDRNFSLPAFFLIEERYTELGPAIILWLRLVIEQQARRRYIRIPDKTLADWLHTSRATISIYKQELKELGYL